MKRGIQNGICLIVDPSVRSDLLLKRLKDVVYEPIAAVQIWDNFNTVDNAMDLVKQILDLCHPQNIPVLINNHWEMLKLLQLDGIHLDQEAADLEQRKEELKRQIIIGITCNNDLSVVQWAHDNKVDYISFCSMFHSSTANSCELVSFDTIRKARTLTTIPLFLSGGIKPGNMQELDALDYSGIAVVSGIMNSDTPIDEIRKYQQRFKHKL